MDAVRRLTVAAVIAASAHVARADDGTYPARLVDRAPFLPAGLDELGVQLLVPRDGDIKTSLLDVSVRRGLGRVEPIVGATIVLDPTQDASTYGDAYLGARVPITCVTDVRVKLSTGVGRTPEGAMFAENRAFAADLAIETRYPISALNPQLGWLRDMAFYGQAGGLARYHHLIDAPTTLPDALVPPTEEDDQEIAYATGGLELQATDVIAFEVGVGVTWGRTARAGMSSVGATDEAYVSLVQTSPGTDLIVTVSSVDEGTSNGFAISGALASRF
jgi:hypothetical protein